MMTLQRPCQFWRAQALASFLRYFSGMHHLRGARAQGTSIGQFLSAVEGRRVALGPVVHLAIVSSREPAAVIATRSLTAVGYSREDFSLSVRSIRRREGRGPGGAT